MALLDDHGPSLLALIRRLCRNANDADDVFQETAIRVWKSLTSGSYPNNPRSWLFMIAYRVYLDGNPRQREMVELPDLHDGRTRSPQEISEQSEFHTQLQSAISQLSLPLRDVVILHYTGSLTIRETATAMNLTEGTVKSRLNSALNQLRSALNELR